MAKYYAVRKGKTTGLFTDWPSCQESIKGYSGAEYSSFTTEKEALLYLMGEEKKKKTVKSEIQKLKKSNQCNVFTSGSYEKGEQRCNLVIIVETLLDKTTYFSVVIDEFCEKQQTIAAEILSAFVGLQIAVEQGFEEINLYSNYEGIKRWATKEWTPKNTVVSYFVRYIDNTKDCKINVYQLRDVDKEQKKTLRYYTGYASSSRHIIALQQILDGKVVEETMEAYHD